MRACTCSLCAENVCQRRTNVVLQVKPAAIKYQTNNNSALHRSACHSQQQDHLSATRSHQVQRYVANFLYQARSQGEGTLWGNAGTHVEGASKPNNAALVKKMKKNISHIQLDPLPGSSSPFQHFEPARVKPN